MGKKGKPLSRKKSNAGDESKPETPREELTDVPSPEVTPAKEAPAHAAADDTFFTPAPGPATPGSATPTDAPKHDALLRELADLKNQLAHRDTHISTLQEQLAQRDAEVATLRAQLAASGAAAGERGAPEAAAAPDEIGRLQERLGALKEEQARADAARAAAWAELRSCVADISKLANVNHTPGVGA